jgi:hypothetical protein
MDIKLFNFKNVVLMLIIVFIIGFISVLPVNAEKVTNGLVFSYDNKTIINGKILDSSGNNINANVHNASMISINNQVTELRFINWEHYDYLSIDDSPLTNVNTFTFNAWVNLNYTSGSLFNTIFEKRVYDESGYWFGTESLGRLYTYWINNGNLVSHSSNAYVLGNDTDDIHYLSATYDSHYLIYYVDGIEVTKIDVSNEPSVGDSLNIPFNINEPGSDHCLYGNLYAASEYNRALSVSEILSNFNDKKDSLINISNAIAAYYFNLDNGNTVYDNTGNGWNLTNSGSILYNGYRIFNSSKYISGNLPYLDKNCSVHVYFKPTVINGWQTIVDFGSDIYPALRLNPTGKLLLQDSNGWYKYSVTSLLANKKYDIVVYMNSANPSTWGFYINGVLDNSGESANVDGYNQPGSKIWIGQDKWGEYQASMELYSLEFFNKTLTNSDAYKLIDSVKADFSFSQNIGTLQVKFNDLSIGIIDNYNWSFGDNTANSTVENPLKLYSDAKKYTVILTVRNDVNVSVISKEVNVIPIGVNNSIFNTMWNIILDLIFALCIIGFTLIGLKKYLEHRQNNESIIDNVTEIVIILFIIIVLAIGVATVIFNR